MSEAQAKERLIEIMRDDLAATDDPAGPRIATLARYAAMRQVEPLLTADERKELLEDVSLVLLATLDMYESTQIRMQLVDVYLELGRNSDAAAMLLTVAENNNGFEPQNEETFAQVNLKVMEMETKGQITDAEALAVRDELVRWSQEKKQAEDDAKKAQEELEKFDVDPTTGKPKTTAEKALEEANKTTGGATAGTTATTTGN
jgi:hypothetical protein